MLWSASCGPAWDLPPTPLPPAGSTHPTAPQGRGRGTRQGSGKGKTQREMQRGLGWAHVGSWPKSDLVLRASVSSVRSGRGGRPVGARGVQPELAAPGVKALAGVTCDLAGRKGCSPSTGKARNSILEEGTGVQSYGGLEVGPRPGGAAGPAPERGAVQGAL